MQIITPEDEGDEEAELRGTPGVGEAAAALPEEEAIPEEEDGAESTSGDPDGSDGWVNEPATYIAIDGIFLDALSEDDREQMEVWLTNYLLMAGYPIEDVRFPEGVVEYDD